MASGGKSGYAVGGSASTASGRSSAAPDQDRYWSHARCKRAYLSYLMSKREEIDEQQDSRRYRHGAQWTAAQIRVLNDRKQPVVTFNRVGRKIDGIVGLVEKLRQDAKAFPNTPAHEEGAELANHALRYALDKKGFNWGGLTPIAAEAGAVDGIGGIELDLVPSRFGDHDVAADIVQIDGYFYDPRSVKPDFSDVMFEGVGKWVDPEAVKEMMPGVDPNMIDQAVEVGSELSSDSDQDNRWFSVDGDLKRIRLVDIWYRHNGGWCWCLFTGVGKLMEGQSPFLDEDGKATSKFVMYSAAIDHDGDRYGFVRNLKSAQDEINQRRSKGLHELNTRRIVGEAGAFDDVEAARREAARPDGVVLRNPGFTAEFDDAKKAQDIAGQVKFLEDAKQEIENFGPNPALVGTGVQQKSGRAIALMQQAGIAELGPYMISFRNWKLRVYRAVFNAIQRNWTAERWIRVTDDEGLAQFIRLNAMQADPMTGMPVISNALGQLDVDIRLDEGPDSVTMMEDMYETLSNVIPSIAPMLDPAEARAVVRMLIDTSPLAASQKKSFRDAAKQAQQPDPMRQQAQQIALAGEVAKVKETESKAVLNMAKAQEAGQPEAPQGMQPQPEELPMEVQVAQAVADIENTQADTQQKRMAAFKTETEAMLAPQKAAHDADLARAQFAQNTQDKAEDRKLAARQAQNRTAPR